MDEVKYSVYYCPMCDKTYFNRSGLKETCEKCGRLLFETGVSCDDWGKYSEEEKLKLKRSFNSEPDSTTVPAKKVTQEKVKTTVAANVPQIQNTVVSDERVLNELKEQTRFLKDIRKYLKFFYVWAISSGIIAIIFAIIFLTQY